MRCVLLFSNRRFSKGFQLSAGIIVIRGSTYMQTPTKSKSSLCEARACFHEHQ